MDLPKTSGEKPGSFLEVFFVRKNDRVDDEMMPLYKTAAYSDNNIRNLFDQQVVTNNGILPEEYVPNER